MNRREFAAASASLAAAGTLSAQNTPAPKTDKAGRIKQAVAQWCYRDMSVEELAKQSAALGITGMDLVGPKDWAVCKKYGIVPTMAPGPTTIPDGLNRREHHDKIVAAMRPMLEEAKAAGVPNLIVFSGNRKGMSDQEGLENCVIGLNRVKGMAEEIGVTICMELLNSKVNHPDYMCDRTHWGVELVKRVNSPRVKLLYDIYHMQIMEGDVIRTIRANHQYIGHYHTGGVPGRNEIDASQELNYTTISKAIADLGFTGYMAHEFIPKRTPIESLKQAVDICAV
jgi:hydroxypyruvate isomerase